MLSVARFERTFLVASFFVVSLLTTTLAAKLVLRALHLYSGLSFFILYFLLYGGLFGFTRKYFTSMYKSYQYAFLMTSIVLSVTGFFLIQRLP